MTRPPAEEVANELLERTGEGLRSGDFDLFLSAFRVPQLVRTYEGARVLETVEEVCNLYEEIRGSFQQRGVTDLIRICMAAHYVGSDRIESTHVSHLFCGAQRLSDPYPVFSVIENDGSGWQIVSSDYAVDKRMPQNRALNRAGKASPSGKLPEPPKTGGRHAGH